MVGMAMMWVSIGFLRAVFPDVATRRRNRCGIEKRPGLALRCVEREVLRRTMDRPLPSSP